MLYEVITTISIRHSKICQISNIDGHIENSLGQVVRKLNCSEIKEYNAYSNISFYTDDMNSEFTLKHNSYPYVIEYSYETKETDFLDLESWAPILDWGIPTRDANLIIRVPNDYNLSVEEQIRLKNG